MKQLLKYLLEQLREWNPCSIDRALFSQYSTSEVSRFIQTVNQAWAADYIEEFNRCVDTLILMSYSRQSLKLGELSELLIKFATQPVEQFTNSALNGLLEHSMRSERQRIDSALEAMNFRHIMLFSGCFQFWRLFLQTDDVSQMVHPMLQPSTPAYTANVFSSSGGAGASSSASAIGTSNSNKNSNGGNSAEDILEILQVTTDSLYRSAQEQLQSQAQQGFSNQDTGMWSAASTALTVRPNASTQQMLPTTVRIALYLWMCFLQSYAHQRSAVIPAEFVTTQTFLKFQTLVEHLELVDMVAQD